MENNYSFNTNDKTGFETLNSLSKAERLNNWIFDTIKPFVSGSILEIGSGIGNISTFFIRNNYNISLSDINYCYLNELKKKYKDSLNVKDIVRIDLGADNFKSEYEHLKESYDTIFLLNVLEHIKDDYKAIENSSFLLKPEGKLIILIPAHAFLFSKMDEQLGHYRRYSRKTILQKVYQPNFLMKRLIYFNALGIIAWLYGKILGLKKLPSTEISFFDKLVSGAKVLDKLLFNKVGLSLIIVLEKKPLP